MSPDASFKNPPLVEFALGVQFDRLSSFRAGHLGRFWECLGVRDWPEVSDAPLIEDQFEAFDSRRVSRSLAPQLRLTTSPVVGRMRLQNSARDRMIQLQPTRLHFNWLKTSTFKPRYRELVTEFLAMVEKLSSFLHDCKIGELKPNQWEVTYVDAFPKGDYWNTPADWKTVLPELFAPLDRITATDLSLDYRNAEWSFEITPDRGRLHLNAGPGSWPGDDRESLILTTTARGPTGARAASSLKAGLDLGHDKAVEVFLKVVNAELMNRWR